MSPTNDHQIRSVFIKTDNYRHQIATFVVEMKSSSGNASACRTSKKGRAFLISRWLLVFSVFAVAGCKSDNDDFSFVEAPTDDVSIETTEPPQILAFTPTADPVRMVESGKQTFAVSVQSKAGQDVQYEFSIRGSVLAKGSNPFYVLEGALAPPGISELVVKATNSIGSNSKSFVVQKNRAPTIDTSSPAVGGNDVTCGGGSIVFEITASDPDADGLSYQWKLNGASGVMAFSINSTGISSRNVFSPSCNLSGINTVTVDVSDGFEMTSFTWTVNITNPSVAQITAYSPLSTPVIITSSGSQDFSISATGKAPLTYAWKLGGTPIPGATNALLTLTAAGLSIGNHTLEAVVNDPDSSDSRIFNVKRNAPPTISNPSPNLTSVRLNYETIRAFSVDVTDANGDPLSYTWRLNGSTHPALSSTNTGTGTQAIFAPNSSLLGTNTIEVIASDGTESATRSWTVQVNLFSQACNDLSAGQICTVIGSPGLGSGLNPQTQSTRVKVYPTDIVDDGAGLFIADHLSDVIWYYNRSGNDVTRLGQTIQAGRIRVLVGNGGEGTTSTPGSSNTGYQLFNPYSIAWDPVAGRLFIANYSTHRILTVDSDGSVQHYLCSGLTNNDNARHPLDGAATAHACIQPTGLAWDAANKYLYVAALGHHYIKRFDLSDPNPENWTGRLVLGRQNSGGAVSGGGEDGDLAPGTSASIARTNQPWGLQVDANGLLHLVEHSGCRLRIANPTGTARTFAGLGVTVNPNKVVSVRGTYGSCTTETGAAGRLHRPRGLGLWQNGGNVLGWFISMSTQHRLLFLNNSESAVTIGDRVVPSGHGELVWGTGIAGYGGENGPARTNLINDAWTAIVSATDETLLLADTNNQMIRSLRLDSNNGAIGMIVGGGAKVGDAVGPSISADLVRMNRPTYLLYDPDTNSLIYSDTSNTAIRSISLLTGTSSNLIGGTSGAGNIEQEAPLNALLRVPTGLTKFNSGIVYADAENSNAANRNCQVRAFNPITATQEFWSRFVNSNRIATVAGSYSIGCGTYIGEGGAATSARLRQPEGITTDGTNLYIANYNDHCILRVAIDGTITRYLGQCGTQGHSEAAAASSDNNLFRFPTAIFADPAYPGSGNLFIADQTNQPTGRIKYANMTGGEITISGVPIPANSIRTLYTTGGYSLGVTAFAEQICYSSGNPLNGSQGAHNVICTNRTDPLQNTTMRAGAITGATLSAGSQMFNEHEGVAAPTALLYGPYGLAFDQEGNLYISENGGHVNRMIKRWW